MNRVALVLIGGGALAVVGFLLASKAEAATPAESGAAPGPDVSVASSDPSLFWASLTAPSGISDMSNILKSTAGPEANRAAFLKLIRTFESGDSYNILYGGGTFDSYADHPRQYIPINIPGYEGQYSSAAGAYQFIWSTWNNLRNKLGLPDFSPQSQDAAALELLREIGALDYIDRGDLDNAMRVASSQWASLPYSSAKQNPQSIEKANVFLASELGDSAVA